MKYAFVAAVAVVSGLVSPNIASAQSNDQVLKRLDALEKRNAQLEQIEKENAALRERVRRLEGTKAFVVPVSAGAASNTKYGPGGAALAADMSVKARPYAPAATFNWTGCYIGGHAGGGVMNDGWTDEHGIGGLAGGQIGCDWQTGQLVVGLAASGSWSGIKSHFSERGDDDFDLITRNRWDFDISARLGFAIDRALIYGKVGAAWGKFNFRYQDAFDAGDHDIGSGTFKGLLLGTGFEYAFAPNWTAMLEYNYIGYPNKVVHFTSTVDDDYDLSSSASKHIVKVGLNYRFGGLGKGPVVAGY